MVLTDAGAGSSRFTRHHVPIEAVFSDVQLTAYKPFRPGEASRFIQELLIGSRPLKSHVLDSRLPEPLGIPHGSSDELLPVAQPVQLDEIRHPALQILACGMPDNVGRRCFHGSLPGAKVKRVRDFTRSKCLCACRAFNV